MSDEKKAEIGAIGFAGLETFLSDFSKDANQATSGQHSTTDFGANTTAEGSTITGKNTNPPPKPKSTIIKSFRSLLIPLGIDRKSVV